MTEEEAREAMPVPFEDIKAQLLAVVEKCNMPEPARTSKIRLLMQAASLAGPPPALKLTREQIAARRPAEQAEIERYRRRMEDE